MSQTKVHFGVLSGLCAGFSSLCGKLMSISEQLVSAINFGQILNPWLLKVIFLVIMIACNSLVWTFFVKALHQKGGSLVATVTSAATNYAISALLGWLIFGEATSLLWLFGTSLVIIGVVLITTDQSIEEKLKPK